MFSEDDPAFELTAAEDAMADMSAAAVSLLAGPAAPLAGPLLAKGFKKVNRDFKRDQAEQAAGVFTGAVDELDVAPIDLLKRIRGPEARSLFARAMNAGANTASAEKIVALGRVLARGLGGDQASIDVDLMIVAALADMEAPHIKVLGAMGGDDLYAGSTSHTGVLIGEFPGYRSVLPAILAVLERHGLIRLGALNTKDIESAQRYGSRITGGSVGHERWELTSFGVECLAFLRPVPALPPGDGDQ